MRVWFPLKTIVVVEVLAMVETAVVVVPLSMAGWEGGAGV